ncbi:hypothetical protein [Methylobacterium nodulans]|uniref:Uncharacterized protein n=1 Tax=Methylobacterium nodulans (strain LMG 21967 / CNCM I-2342 / ORS 2060) TaxID=460265 RepID=B8IV17_METNO|nr:hypothetical protein [Methylobacterium nodulans]ACL59075.1 conserved hypothetical protein [Methylobacterium nodulans ORS 2060]
MHQNKTEMSGFHPGSPFLDRLRDAAMLLTLAVGIPLTLAWVGLVGWSVVWLICWVL